MSNCSCSDHDNDSFDAGASPAPAALISWTSAFAATEPRQGDEPLTLVGDMLLTAGGSIRILARGLRDVDTGCQRGRDALADALTGPFGEAAQALEDSGKEALEGHAGDVSGGVGRAAELIQQAAGRLAEVDLDAGALDSFPLYAEILAGPASRLAAFGEAVDSDDFGPAAGSLISAAYTASSCLDAALSGGRVIVPGISFQVAVATNPCAGCPFVACTEYTRDDYVSVIGCTSSMGVTVCRYNVRRTVKRVCCCYDSRWDRFWAINCCSKTTTISPPVALVLRRTHLGTPPTPPFRVVSDVNRITR